MSLYKGYAEGAGAFRPVKVNDPSKKILDQGQRFMQGQEKLIADNAEQTKRLLAVFDQNVAIEKQQARDNFELGQMYADTLAQRKWRNFEIAVQNAKTRQSQAEKDRQALLDLTVSGARLGKTIHTHNQAAAEKTAQWLQVQYGIGRKAFNTIKSAEQSIINNNESLQGLLRKLELKGDIPMDVISKIRKSGGYLNFAVEKNSATRFGQKLTELIGQRANEPIKLAGVERPISLNAALETNASTTRSVVEELIRQELTLENGSPRYSTKVMALAGLTGHEGFVSRTIGTYAQQAEKITKDNEWNDRHIETIQVLKAFMGPADGTATPVGAAGIDAAILYFAGGEGASRESLQQSRTRVVNALANGLETQTIKWSQVAPLENYIVKTKGAPGGKKWSRLFEKEWNQLQDAGRKFYEEEQADLQLQNAEQHLKGQRFLSRVKSIVANEGVPQPNQLATLIAHAQENGYHDAGTYLAGVQARGLTTANDAYGQSILLSRAANGETITSTEIEALNFSKPAEAQARALVAKHNDTVPQPGKNGTRERLQFAIKAKLESHIERKNTWYTNSTHKDAEIKAMQLASAYYQSARDKGESHENAYTYAVTQIEDKIDTDVKNKKGYFEIKSKGGVQYWSGARPGGKFNKPIELNRKTIAKELNENPGLIFTKEYFDPTDIAQKANRGIYREPHRTAMLIQSLSRGKINAVDAMQAQLQLKRNQEIKETGSATTQLLPESYVRRYKQETDKLRPQTLRLLNSINSVDASKAYVKSGYQPPNQESYYNKANAIIEIGDPNAITNAFDGRVGNSRKLLKYDITEVSISEVLQLMENGHFNRAGNAQFDYDSLKETALESGLGFDAKFSEVNQRKLQNVRFKKHGLAGFPHVEYDADQLHIGNNVHQNLNSEKIETVTYFRSPAACNIEACAWLKENKPEIYGGLYK